MIELPGYNVIIPNMVYGKGIELDTPLVDEEGIEETTGARILMFTRYKVSSQEAVFSEICRRARTFRSRATRNDELPFLIETYLRKLPSDVLEDIALERRTALVRLGFHYPENGPLPGSPYLEIGAGDLPDSILREFKTVTRNYGYIGWKHILKFFRENGYNALVRLNDDWSVPHSDLEFLLDREVTDSNVLKVDMDKVGSENGIFTYQDSVGPEIKAICNAISREGITSLEQRDDIFIQDQSVLTLDSFTSHTRRTKESRKRSSRFDMGNYDMSLN
jgi:hypothetical protein